MFNAPDPDCTVVVEVVLVDPNVAVFTPAPVAMFIVLAVASAEIPTVPVPLAIVIAPLVAVRVKAPEPDCIAVEDVVLTEPKVTVLAPAPVARLTVVAVASVLMPIVPVPELIVIAPVVVNANPPLPA